MPTTPVQGATRSPKLSRTEKALRERTGLATSNGLAAYRNPTHDLLPELGELGPAEAEALRHDVATEGVTYVVQSFRTPIAWVTGTGRIHHVRQRFSMTTSHHQTIARTNLI